MYDLFNLLIFCLILIMPKIIITYSTSDEVRLNLLYYYGNIKILSYRIIKKFTIYLFIYLFFSVMFVTKIRRTFSEFPLCARLAPLTARSAWSSSCTWRPWCRRPGSPSRRSGCPTTPRPPPPTGSACPAAAAAGRRCRPEGGRGGLGKFRSKLVEPKVRQLIVASDWL